MTLIVEIGQRFGALVAIENVPGRRGVARRIKCRCDCGNEYLALPHSLTQGKTLRCYACWPKRRTAEYITFRRRLNNYQHSSKRKNLSFTFDADQFRKFYDAPCTYCGFTPAQGIDRKDSTLGYIEGNCVPACAECNYAKRNATEAAFLSWVARIAAHQGFSL